MLGIDNLLLNFLFILVSVLIYFPLAMYRKIGNKTVIIAAFSSLAVVVCMTFPFTVAPGYIYDLRTVPFLISVVYGGYASGGFVALVMFAYRYLIGGSGFVPTFISYTILLGISAIILETAKRRRYHSKVALGTILGLSSALLFVTVNSIKAGPVFFDNIPFFIYFCLLLTVSAWICFYIIEALRENMRMRDEIQRTEKLQMLGELAATIAHEIRNPMTVAKGFVQLLVSRSKDEVDRRYSGMVMEEIDRAEIIISDYLMYARPQAEQIERLDVKQSIISAVNMMEPYIVSNGHTLSTRLEHSLYIEADSKKMIQVFVNLFKHAVEAMEQSGEITVTAERVQNRVLIRISDTGSAMSTDQVARLGNPYYSTTAKGTGLGLMVTYRIVEALHGEIRVKSVQGEGTTFSLYLPCAAGP